MTLKCAVIGTGRIAEMKLLPALQEADGAELWSVMSRDRNRAREIATRFAARSPDPGHDTLDAMLADPALDAVIIATPDKLHAEQAMAAAKAGKHVFCEKPMATSVDEAEAMVTACRDAGVTLGVAYHLRWHAGLRPLHQAITRDGLIGTPRHMRVQWTFQAPDAGNWRAGTDVGKWWGLAGVGTHLLDQILWFLEPNCGPVVEIKSLVAKDVFKGPNDETALIALKFQSGATAELCSSVLFAAPTRFEIYGSAGWAVGDDVMAITGAGALRTHQGAWDYTPVDCYRLEIEDFAAAVRDNRAPEADGGMGAQNTRILVEAAG